MIFSPVCSEGSIRSGCWSTFIPLAACVFSLCLMFISVIRSKRYRHKLPSSRTVPVSNAGTLEASPPQQYITTTSTFTIVFEVVVLLADVAVSVALLVNAGAPFDYLPNYTSGLFSTYLLLLLVGRSYSPEAGLQAHSLCLYTVQWLCVALDTPAVLVQDDSLARTAILLRLLIFTGLCFAHCLSSPVPIKLFKFDDVLFSEPGRDETASLFSILTFWWVNDLLWKAFRATLEASDLYPLNRNLASGLLAPAFRARTAASSPFVWKIYNFFKRDIFKQGLWAVIMSIAVFIPPLLMRAILQYLESPGGMTHNTAWLCVGGLLVSGILAAIADCQCNWIGNNIAAKLRTVLISEVYSKVLRKSIARPNQPKSAEGAGMEDLPAGQASDGNILNLISVDAEVISQISASLYLVWVTFPLQTVLGTYLLYRILGISGVIGVLLMIALVPLNILVSKRMMVVQGHVLKATDARIQASNELLNNIRTIKYCAWESPFSEQVLEKRSSEMKRMRSRFVWWSISMTLFHLLPFIMSILTFFFYTVVWNNELGTTVVFPALAIFGLLRIPLNRMADAITFLLQAYVSLQRISKFLDEEETQKYLLQGPRYGSRFIGFDDATLRWPTVKPANLIEETTLLEREASSAQPFQLHGLQIELLPGRLVVVCGPSGSGKSSLLLALCGEMDLISGDIYLPRKPATGNTDRSRSSSYYPASATAYCPQEPWIMNRSIRDNILLGLPFEGPRYDKVLHAVALLHDLASFDQGDETLAGENGARLSGGQKQRIALARALYSQSEYVLLDDCLSAVDSKTANHIFFNAIKGPLMRDRICILATHSIQLAVPQADHVIVLEAGQVMTQDSGKNIIASRYVNFAATENVAKQLVSTSTEEVTNENPDTVVGSSRPMTAEPETLERALPTENPASKPNYEESKPEGSVPWAIVKQYLTSMGPIWYWIIVLSGFAGQQLVSLGAILWVKQWALQYDLLLRRHMSVAGSLPNTNGENGKVAVGYYLIVYTLIGILNAIISFSRDMTVFYGSLKASSSIYKRLLSSILHAKLLFFDQVPLGQITNRLSRDVEVVDQQVSTFGISAMQLVASLVVTVILISSAIPALLLVALIILVAYSCVGGIYISGARDFKRIESVERSPLYQQFGETLAGSVSLRAYARTAMFTAENHSLLDRLNRPYLLLSASKEWLTFRIGTLSSLISFAAGTFILWNMDTLNPGTAGLVLTYAATFTENVLWLVHVYAIIQQNLNSVERIAEYSTVEQEPTKPLKPASYTLPPNWPTHGEVSFHSYSTRYAPELEPTLKEISFAVIAGSRVAIVGRTGAGKSTITLSLIRGLEASSGYIEIDGIDIASLTLPQLRQAVTIVPQDPKLFEGSIRDNLSPLRTSSDDDMIAALRSVHLLGGTDSNPISSVDLDRPAATLSRGQRQLLCIARGLLRKSRILVLDEATASVDHETDTAIQEALRDVSAAGTTVLTIAHRLLTIADYDHVVVLDGGRVAEQGGVGELVGKRGEGAVFWGLCRESGDGVEIERIANRGKGKDGEGEGR